ncbi:MAG: arginine N-succinyltransferase [Caulobacterales bacterium]|jgi:arginine N-succinyltransferase
MSADPTYVIRAARASDIKAFIGLRDIAGAGFTSLMVDEATLAKRLEATEAAYRADVRAPGSERYLLMLEHIESGAVVGTAAVKATVGARPPFFNFRVLTIAQASSAAERRFDMDVLILVNEFTGCSEVGSLFVQPEHRAGGAGRALAQSRYMLIGAGPDRFNLEVVSELRGVVDGAGRSPFWDHLGRHFFKMSFEEADRLSATTDNQFILDLMPKYPIYVDLLAEEARAVIGKCHPQGEGAKRLLEWEGFRHDYVVDIFDGGPLMSAGRDMIRTRREARRLMLKAGTVAGGVRALVATDSVTGFACAPTRIVVDGDVAVVSSGTLRAIGLEPGETAIVWCDNAQ